MDTSKSLQVLVYGGTGTQAAPTVAALLRRGHRPHVLTRHPERHTALEAAGARLVAGDLDDPRSLRAASEGMDAVSLVLPSARVAGVGGEVLAERALAAARDASVPHVVWNASGHIPAAPTGVPTLDVRARILALLRASGLGFVVIEPTVYLENLLSPWVVSSMARGELPYPVATDTRVAWIAAEDVGALTVAALERPALSGHHFRVSGLEDPDGHALARGVSRVLGRKVRYRAAAPSELGDAIDRLAGPGAGDDIAALYRLEATTGGRGLARADMQDVLAHLPVRMTPLETWLRRRAAAFSG
jgi:uncharacterized protein YbjT (DUF2867 family)